MRKISTEVSVHVSAERLWEVLTDIASYAEWNPYLISGEGVVQEKKRLKIGLKIDQGHAFFEKPRIKMIDQPVMLKWKSMLYIPGVFDKERTFEVVPDGPHKSTFIHTEIWSGFTEAKVYEKLGKSTEKAMKEMNQALRKRVKQ